MNVDAWGMQFNTLQEEGLIVWNNVDKAIEVNGQYTLDLLKARSRREDRKRRFGEMECLLCSQIRSERKRSVLNSHAPLSIFRRAETE